MGRRVGHHPGGIQGLIGFLREHGEAVEYDLIALGLRLEWLGSERLTWCDLRAIIHQAPRDSAVARSTLGEHAPWDLASHLLASVVDALHAIIWQLGGGKGPRPKLLPRPGSKQQSMSFGSDPIPASKFEEWWNSGAISE